MLRARGHSGRWNGRERLEPLHGAGPCRAMKSGEEMWSLPKSSGQY